MSAGVMMTMAAWEPWCSMFCSGLYLTFARLSFFPNVDFSSPCISDRVYVSPSPAFLLAARKTRYILKQERTEPLADVLCLILRSLRNERYDEKFMS